MREPVPQTSNAVNSEVKAKFAFVTLRDPKDPDSSCKEQYRTCFIFYESTFLDVAQRCLLAYVVESPMNRCNFCCSKSNTHIITLIPVAIVFLNRYLLLLFSNAQISNVSALHSEDESLRGSNVHEIELKTDAVALFVWLSAGRVRGRFSDNGFIMVDKTTSLTFTSDLPLDVAQLRLNISVTCLNCLRHAGYSPIADIKIQ